MPVEPQLVRDVFLEVVELPPADRERSLTVRCGSDRELRAAVERLLAAHEEPARILESGPTVDFEPPSVGTLPDSRTSAAERADRIESLAATEDPDATSRGPSEGQSSRRPSGFVGGLVIAGRYTLQQVLGEGGMGTVYRADQTQPVKRQVALKVIKIGMDSRMVLARFDAERQALALMDHPNIARVFDGGTTDGGQPFFVMELVRGVPISAYCDAKRLSVKARLELFVTVCQAVQHAHQKGIIHRDLKPSNVMVTEVDGRPTPKVIDFGVAKATEFSLTDQSVGDTGAIVGTPTYMSPEQADPTSMDIDTRTDIYALGAILYELLAGSPPLDPSQFRRGAVLEMLRMVREIDPPKPSTKVSTADALPNIAASRGIEPAQLRRALSGDLDWIVMKALEKDRTRRYESANGFAADILRHLASEPVLAAPPSRTYRLRKFARKHRGGVIAASLVLVTLLAGIAGTTWGWYAARRSAFAERRAKLDAQNHQARAEERESQAIDAVKRFGDAVAGERALKNNANLDALRRRLLKEPLAFFKNLRDRLQDDKDTRPESLERLAAASFELGTLTDEIGDKRDALIAYRESLGIYQKLADAYPTEPAHARNLANCHNLIGELLQGTGQPAEALTAFESALAISQKLVDANPAVAEFERILADSHNNIGTLRMATGERAAALKALASARAIYQKSADANPSMTGLQNDLADTDNNIGNILYVIGNPTEALKAYESAQSIWRKLVDANPAGTEFQSSLATGYNNVGNLLRATGKPGEALQAYESALAISQKLAVANPTVTEFQKEMAMSYGNIGKMLYAGGKPADALKAHESAKAISQKLADANPTVTEFGRDLASCQNNIGNVLMASGKPTEALAAFESSRAIRRKLANANPTITDYQQELATSLSNLCNALMATGKPAEALEAAESAVSIRQRMARNFPDSPEVASALGESLNNAAAIDVDAKRFEKARDRLREAIRWQRKALAVYPAHPRYRQSLHNHFTGLGVAAQALGDTAGVSEATLELAKLRDSEPAIVALDKRLAAVVNGAEQPKDEADRLELAQRAYDKSLYATAARLWSEALASNPGLGVDRRTQHRYNAACAAALAGCGQGKENPAPDESTKSKLRKETLDWLKAELADWTKLLESDAPNARQLVAQTLAHWRNDTDLAGIREEKQLAKLSEAERSSFKKLWSDVSSLLTKAGAGKSNVGTDQ